MFVLDGSELIQFFDDSIVVSFLHGNGCEFQTSPQIVQLFGQSSFKFGQCIVSILDLPGIESSVFLPNAFLERIFDHGDCFSRLTVFTIVSHDPRFGYFVHIFFNIQSRFPGLVQDGRQGSEFFLDHPMPFLPDLLTYILADGTGIPADLLRRCSLFQGGIELFHERGDIIHFDP